MARAWLPRQCAFAHCGASFTPSSHRQRYCSPEHSHDARNARFRNANCAQCGKSLEQSEFRRFCDGACRGAYSQARRNTRGKRVIEPMVVLLPSGCAPTRVTLETLPEAYGEVVRKIYCRRYERCLSYAVSKNWGGFGCQDCKVDECDPPQPMSNPKGGNWSW